MRRALVLAPVGAHRQVIVDALKRCGLDPLVVDQLDGLSTAERAGTMVAVVVSGAEVVPEQLVGQLRTGGLGWCPMVVAMVAEGPDSERAESLRSMGADAVIGHQGDAERLAESLRGILQTHATGAGASAGEGLTSSFGRYRSTPDGRFLEANQALVEMLGYDCLEELLAVDISRDVYVNPQVRHSLLAGPVDDFHMVEVDWKRKDGRPITVQVSARAVRDAQGRILAYEGVVQDVSRRRELEYQVQAAVVYSPIATMVVAGDGRIVSFNRAAEGLTGYGAGEMATIQQWADRLGLEPSGEQEATDGNQGAPAGWALPAGECRITRKDGQQRLVRFHVSSFPRGHIVQMLDVTEQRRAEEAAERRLRLLQRVIELHERDRQLIAYELHDGFCQQLSGAIMQFQAYQHLRESRPEEAARCFDKAMGQLGQSITEARRLIGGLRPPVLDESGIVGAVDYLVAEAAEDGGIRVLFNQNLGPKRLPSSVETCLFRIIQEAVRNARRYSQSRCVQVNLVQEGDEIVLSVHDGGGEGDPQPVAGGHFDLQGIRERAQWLGGTAQIQGRPGQGMQITVRLPLTTEPDR
ncbi:MAG TPA: PAS domain S-box protein [Planctomycetaceae bacterium]|nr:PAS domain S-box protein [Planctomycetaceae bacterium]